MTVPRFDEPTYTVSATTLLADATPDVSEGGPLPTLLDPDAPLVVNPSDEAMVRIEHPRVRVLANYWHAGWPDAIASTWLRAAAFDHLAAVAESLPDRWGLAVFDAWRPLALQRALYEAGVADPEVEPGFMAPPSEDPAAPPPHLTGGAVDLTLTVDGTPLAPGTGFDDTTARAHADHLEDQPSPARHVRRALFHAMAAQGFVIYTGEWWHFEYGTRRWASITGNDPMYGPTQPAG